MMYDCVVIGAGLAGSGSSIALARRGWRVLLIERQAGAHHKVCGEFLSPESQQSFRALGVHAAIAAQAPAEMTTARFVSRNGISLAMALPGTAWGLSRYSLDATLLHEAVQAKAEVRSGVTATDVTLRDGVYTVTLRSARGETTQVESRAVLSACGRHPLPGLRPHNQATRARQTYVGMKGHWRGLDLPPEVQIYLFNGGYAGLSPIEREESNLCMLVTRAAFRAAGSTVCGLMAAAARGNPALARVLRNGEHVADTDCAVAPVDTACVPTPWDGYARVGDAVAMIPPLCGDGMSMALRSAVLCADSADAFLAGRTTLAQWEATYRADWHKEFKQRLFVGQHLQRWLSLPLFNDALLVAGNIVPPAAQALVRATRGAV